MQAYIHPDGEWGEVHGFANGYRDGARIAELIDQAAVELDTEKRAAIYSELQAMLYDDPMWLIGAQEGCRHGLSGLARWLRNAASLAAPQPEVRPLQQVEGVTGTTARRACLGRPAQRRLSHPTA